MTALATRFQPRIIGPSHHRLGGLTLAELHDNSGLPGCFIKELLFNDFKPDTSWSKDLPACQAARQVLHAYDVVSRDARFTPKNSQAYVCLWTTVKLYQRRAWNIGHVVELASFNLAPRTWPRISFVERWGELWEVTSGRVFYAGEAWRWEHFCYRNTEIARHFRGACEGSDCVPCRQIAFIKEYGHGNYGTCQECKEVFALCPDAELGPVIPRHVCNEELRPGWWPETILEPMEAKGRVKER